MQIVPMLRAYLFADPAAHSLSPVMHAAAFRAAGIEGTYAARRVSREDLPAAVASLRTENVLGANLSLPHKEAALKLVDDLTGAARAIGAVNTIIHRGGCLIGDNTDAPGLLEALEEARAPAETAVVLGAGGAARAAVYALRESGREVWVWNRTPDKAGRLAGEFGAKSANFETLPWGDVHLLVNATSAGLSAPDESPLPEFPLLAENALVYDMVYRPAETRLMRDARNHGLRAENGLSMLARQARLSFIAWTDARVPAEVFLEAARAALH